VIVLVPPHNQVFLRLFQTQISHWLSTVPGDVDIGEILPGLTVVLLVPETRQVRLLHVNPLNRGSVIGGLTRCYSVHRVVNLRPILYYHLLRGRNWVLQLNARRIMIIRTRLYLRDLTAGRLLLHLPLDHGRHAAGIVVFFVF